MSKLETLFGQLDDLQKEGEYEEALLVIEKSIFIVIIHVL